MTPVDGIPIGSSEAEHTPGPWFLFGNGHCVGAPTANPEAAEGTAGVAMCAMRLRSPYENTANAKLVQQAPAMKLALDLVAFGLARIERSKTAPTLIEFCFDGLRYSIGDGDWTALLKTIGWQKARDGVAAGR